MSRDADSVEAVVAELRAAKGANEHYDRHLTHVLDQLDSREDLEYRARRFTEDLALALQASILIQAGNNTVSDAFCAARLGGDGYLGYGSLPKSVACSAIVDRANPTG